MFGGPKPVERVAWGEDYTVTIVDGWGGDVDFSVRFVTAGDLAYVGSGAKVDKVRVVSAVERPRYKVRVERY